MKSSQTHTQTHTRIDKEDEAKTETAANSVLASEYLQLEHFPTTLACARSSLLVLQSQHV